MVLKEDRDSSYSLSPDSVTRKWKNDHHQVKGEQYYFNTPNSPDLSPIKNCWGIMKSRLQQEDWFDEGALRNIIVRKWDRLSLDEINRQVGLMWERAKSYLNKEAERTEFQ